jgi:hypothetical protein
MLVNTIKYSPNMCTSVVGKYSSMWPDSTSQISVQIDGVNMLQSILNLVKYKERVEYFQNWMMINLDIT